MELAPGPALTNGRRLVRAVAVLVFATGLALSGARVVGTRFEPVLLVPGVLAVFVGWVLSRLPFPARVIGQLLTFVGSGMAVAYAADGTSADFGRGLLDGPRQVITTAWPSPRFPTIFVALAALIFVASAVSIDLAMRLRWRALAIAPMVVALIALIAVGAPDGPQWQAVLFAATASFVCCGSGSMTESPAFGPVCSWQSRPGSPRCLRRSACRSPWPSEPTHAMAKPPTATFHCSIHSPRSPRRRPPTRRPISIPWNRRRSGRCITGVSPRSMSTTANRGRPPDS